jgi:hypothetical protein
MTQREILKARSARTKEQRDRNDHFQDLKTVSLKKKIEPEVTTISYFYL